MLIKRMINLAQEIQFREFTGESNLAQAALINFGLLQLIAQYQEWSLSGQVTRNEFIL